VRNDQPVPLTVIERDQMHQLTSSARENLVERVVDGAAALLPVPKIPPPPRR